MHLWGRPARGLLHLSIARPQGVPFRSNNSALVARREPLAAKWENRTEHFRRTIVFPHICLRRAAVLSEAKHAIALLLVICAIVAAKSPCDAENPRRSPRGAAFRPLDIVAECGAKVARFHRRPRYIGHLCVDHLWSAQGGQPWPRRRLRPGLCDRDVRV